MSTPTLYDLTLRVGCNLTYEATGNATLLLNVQLPKVGHNHGVVAQQLTCGANLPYEEFMDSHGNRLGRVQLPRGATTVRHDAIVAVQATADNQGIEDITPIPPHEIPADLLRYTLPSRYCDSDKLNQFAWEKFGQLPHGLPRVTAISEWLHNNIEYRFGSGRPDLSAWDVLQRGYGVCRDFAHLAVALNRTFNLPARYATGHLADVGYPDPDFHMDFHAYAEVYLGGHWHVTDPRFHAPRVGRIKIANGADAVDGAFSTIYGAATLTHFEVWAYQVPRGAVNVGDPLDYSLRLDNQWTITTEPPYAVDGTMA